MNNKSIFETLEAKEAKLEAKLNKLRNKNDEAVKAKNNALNEVLKSYFSPIESSLEDMRAAQMRKFWSFNSVITEQIPYNSELSIL